MTVTPITDAHGWGAPPKPVRSPTGLVGDIEAFALASAPRPNETIARYTALGFVAGLSGGSYSVNGLGTNEYFVILAPTGTGKDQVSSVTSKLLAATVNAGVPAMDYKGPGEVASGPGLFKWLAKNPVCFAVLSEFGDLMERMASGRDTNANTVSTAFLKLYPKSGPGEVFDGTAINDPDRKIPSIAQPSFTIIAEGTPEKFFSTLAPRHVESGFLPRFIVAETKERRPYNNANRQAEPPTQLVEDVSAFARECLMLRHGRQHRTVEIAIDAGSLFDAFDKETTDWINSGNEIARQLWSRALVHTLKVAALWAIGGDWRSPMINRQQAEWSINEVRKHIEHLIAKFDRGEVGSVDGDNEKQENAVLRCIYEFATTDFERLRKYGVLKSMKERNAVPKSYLSRRLLSLPTFKNDKRGANDALNRTLKSLCDDDVLQEFALTQREELFKSKARCFAVTDPYRVFEFSDDMKVRGVTFLTDR